MVSYLVWVGRYAVIPVGKSGQERGFIAQGVTGQKADICHGRTLLKLSKCVFVCGPHREDNNKNNKAVNYVLTFTLKAKVGWI